MSLLRNTDQVKRCPKTGKIISSNKQRWPWWLLPFMGLAALVWFLVRVIPKPSRATYPCQRVAFPMASGFVAWMAGMFGSAMAYKRAKLAVSRSKYVAAAICAAVGIGFIWAAVVSTADKKAIAHEPIVANSPIGDAKGIYPGRVAWIYDPDAANWPGALNNTSPPYWHQDVSTDPIVVKEMLSKALRTVSGKSSDEDSWDAIFKNFNQQMGRGFTGYTSGQKIAIKINFVLMNDVVNSGTKSIGYYDQIDNAPQLAIALLRQLIDNAGVNPGDISIGDPTQHMPDYWYNMVSAQCPGVVYLTKPGYAMSGRTQTAFDYNAPFYWSDPVASHFVGVTDADYIPTHFAQSDYFINFPILKSHNGAGITLGGKNHFGSLIRKPPASGGYTPAKNYYNMHWSRLGSTETPGMYHYRAVVDLLGHPKLGGKTMLTLIDGLYAGRSWDSQPIRWDMAPFNGDWPSSILLSQDKIAVDSVAFDFMDYEWDATPDNINGYPQKSGADDYLHEAAMIPSSASGVTYDPNNDGGLTQSLGVHEHWNNATARQYSRNLDPVNGTGIELVTEPTIDRDFYRDGVIDFLDYGILANAWGSEPGDGNWNPALDISIPSDGIIDELDLAIFLGGWLDTIVYDLIAPGATLTEVYSETGTSFEGPMWDPQSGKLFFSRRTSPYKTYRLDSPGSVTSWRDPSPQTNGMYLSLDGRMMACDESTLQITSIRIDPSGPADIQVLADSSDGFTKQPNDLCQLANGNIYFTTPTWSTGSGDPSVQGVWLLRPNGTVTRVNNTIYQPNGIMNSLDDTKLYVSSGSTNTSYQQWWVFDINPDGTLSTATLFFDPTNPPSTSNVPDGMTIDELGNLYFSGLGGIWIVSPQGEQLDFISLPQPVFNVAFGGPNGRTLYMTCSNKVYSLAMSVRGGGNHSW